MLVDRGNMSIVYWARKIMAEHGLIDQGWVFELNNRLSSALGRCTYGKRLIELSTDHAKRDSYENILDTLMHEIAHALVGPGKGHEKEWQAMALKLGARPTSHKSRDVIDTSDVPTYVIMRKMPDGSMLFCDTTNKRFYNQCMSGKKDIKNFTVKGMPHTIGTLSIACMPSSVVAHMIKDKNNA